MIRITYSCMFCDNAITTVMGSCCSNDARILKKALESNISAPSVDEEDSQQTLKQTKASHKKRQSIMSTSWQAHALNSDMENDIVR